MYFDKEEFYKTEIAPLIANIKSKCAAESVPFFMAFCTKNDTTGTKYEKEMVYPDSYNLELKKDLFPDLVNVTIGFKTVLPSEEEDLMNIDVDDLFIEDTDNDNDENGNENDLPEEEFDFTQKKQ